MALLSDQYTEIRVDNIKISGNTISSTDTNGNINLTPSGSGTVVIGGAVDYVTENVTTGGIIKIDVDGTAANAAGSLTLGANQDAGIYWVAGGQLVFEEATALTNAVSYFTLRHLTSGTPANNIGTGLEFEVETSASNYEKIVVLDAVATDAGSGTEDGRLNIKCMVAGAGAATIATVDESGITLAAGMDLIGSSTSDITIATNKFTVAGATGNTLIAGTCDVTGVLTCTAQSVHNGGLTDGTATLNGSGALSGVTTIGNAGTITQTAGDHTIYEDSNNSDPYLALGTAAAESLKIQTVCDTTSKTLSYALFETATASGTADFGEFRFTVDGTLVATIDDGGLEIKASGALSFGAVDILTDSAGTTTLSNIDAIDATTETTLETAIDALSNLVTVGALDSGSITSGFGSINTGASDITTTGTVSGGVVTDGTASLTSGAWTGITTASIAGPITISANSAAITHSGTTTLAITSTSGTVSVESVTFTGGALTGVTTIANAGSITQTAGDYTIYEDANNADPYIALGTSAAEHFKVQAVCNTTSKTLDYVLFETVEAGSTADKGEYRFNVDSTLVATIDDDGIEIKASGKLSFGAVDILTDSAGTTTLNNIDALDATTESTIEAAIDTLGALSLTGDTTYSAGGTRTISIATDNTEGDTLALVAGSGGTGDVNGGALTITGGAGGSGGNNTGGSVTIAGGVDAGTDTGGSVTINGGAGDTNGSVNLGAANTAAVVIGAHWSINGAALTSLTDNNTTLAAYAGKAITIEGTSFDGGAVAGTLETISMYKDAAESSITISCYHDTEATTPAIYLRKADNTQASPAQVDDNAVLGTVLFQGYDDAGFETCAKIEARIDGTPGADDMPTELTFWTSPDGSATAAERVVIEPAGAVVAAVGVQSTSTGVTATVDGTGTGAIGANTSVVVVTCDDANKIITLPAPVVGMQIRIYTASTGCELRTVAASNVKINTVDSDGSNELALAADSMFIAECIASDNWMVRGWTELGADIATLVPDAA